MIIVGVNIGGTFTDFVLFDGKKLNITKILPTPHKPGKAVFEGLRLLEISGKKMTIVHGSTVATNALLEKKGAKVALITTNANLFLGRICTEYFLGGRMRLYPDRVSGFFSFICEAVKDASGSCGTGCDRYCKYTYGKSDQGYFSRKGI